MVKEWLEVRFGSMDRRSWRVCLAIWVLVVGICAVVELESLLSLGVVDPFYLKN